MLSKARLGFFRIELNSLTGCARVPLMGNETVFRKGRTNNSFGAKRGGRWSEMGQWVRVCVLGELRWERQRCGACWGQGWEMERNGSVG